MKNRKNYSLPASPLSFSSGLLSPTSSSASNLAIGPGFPSPGFVELIGRTNFSFLQGASHPEEIVMRARALGYKGVALCDVNGLYGIVRGYQAAEKPSFFDTEHLQYLQFANNDGMPKNPFQYFCGVEITPHDASPIALLPINKNGYVQICHLLTEAKRNSPKGYIKIALQRILDINDDLIGFPLPPWNENELKCILDAFQDRAYLPVYKDFTWESIRLYQQALHLENVFGISPFATNRPLYHVPERKPLHDILTCILHKTTLNDAATRLSMNRERHLKPLDELARIFLERPDLISRTLEIAARIQFSLNELRYKYPQEHLPHGKTAAEYLRELVLAGVSWRYGETPNEKVFQQIDYELSAIAEMEYEDYFLTIWDICFFARSNGILHQGRGSAANSIVCFTLGLTSVDPIKLGLLFERFISRERGEPPDIDIDFEHERREEVIQYIYKKYGERRAAMVCTVITYRSRMAIREIAKAMGISLENIGTLIKFMGREGLSRLVDVAIARDSTSGVTSEFSNTISQKSTPTIREGQLPATEVNIDLSKFGLNEKKFHNLLRLALEMQGFPRHLGIHTGGFVISHEPIVDIVPVESASMKNRYVIQWNKDDIATLGLMKIDVLSLGMLTAIQKAFALLRRHKNIELSLPQIPADCVETYRMIQRADTIGVFQIESRAQMSLLPRLKPANYYDLVIEVAIVRPGPIQGGMIHPYLKRRAGREKVSYAHPALLPILAKTLGIPLFQEQIMQIAVAVAGFTPGEADELRRVISSAWKKPTVMSGLRNRVVNGMLANGITREYADQIYKTIEGFSSYGFPESHAASFALITYVSCYLKHHYPEVFACALLNSQPMGFYSPRQLIADAQRHDVLFFPLDIQYSSWDYTLEPTSSGKHGVRVGLCSVFGLRQIDAQAIVTARQVHGLFHSLSDLIRRTEMSRTTVVRLASAGALQTFGMNPRQALWAIQGMSFDPQSLFFGSAISLDNNRLGIEVLSLPVENSWESLRREYQTKGFALESHPLAVLRPLLLHSSPTFISARQLETLRHSSRIRVAGLMSLLQRPPTAKGMCFISLEDETGLINVVITPDVYQKFRSVLSQSPLLEVEGRLESRDGVRNVRAQTIQPLRVQNCNSRHRVTEVKRFS